MFLLLLACAGSLDTDAAAGSGAGETGIAAEETGAHDTGAPGESSPARFACPAGMAAIPTDSPAWCIDAYEVGLVDGALVSAPALDPLVGFSFEDAVAACAATAALDAAGEPYAMRRLATSEEWTDAGDGVIGDGGATYPWGDAWDDTRCVTPTADGALQFEALQRTGSMPTCVSAFGVYDLVGNAWEWADPGLRFDVDAALATFAAGGVAIAEADDAALVWGGGEVDTIRLNVAGVQPSTLTVTPEGRLEVAAAQIEPRLSEFFGRGNLEGVDLPGPPLPVLLASTDPEDPGASWRVHTAREYDGRTLPDKRGCAWYTGNAGACALGAPSYAHMPDFAGTIGFRCVAPPYPIPDGD